MDFLFFLAIFKIPNVLLCIVRIFLKPHFGVLNVCVFRARLPTKSIWGGLGTRTHSLCEKTNFATKELRVVDHDQEQIQFYWSLMSLPFFNVVLSLCWFGWNDFGKKWERMDHSRKRSKVFFLTQESADLISLSFGTIVLKQQWTVSYFSFNSYLFVKLRLKAIRWEFSFLIPVVAKNNENTFTGIMLKKLMFILSTSIRLALLEVIQWCWNGFGPIWQFGSWIIL